MLFDSNLGFDRQERLVLKVIHEIDSTRRVLLGPSSSLVEIGGIANREESCSRRAQKSDIVRRKLSVIRGDNRNCLFL